MSSSYIIMSISLHHCGVSDKLHLKVAYSSTDVCALLLQVCYVIQRSYCFQPQGQALKEKPAWLKGCSWIGLLTRYRFICDLLVYQMLGKK